MLRPMLDDTKGASRSDSDRTILMYLDLTLSLLLSVSEGVHDKTRGPESAYV